MLVSAGTTRVETKKKAAKKRLRQQVDHGPHDGLEGAVDNVTEAAKGGREERMTEDGGPKRNKKKRTKQSAAGSHKDSGSEGSMGDEIRGMEEQEKRKKKKKKEEEGGA